MSISTKNLINHEKIHWTYYYELLSNADNAKKEAMLLADWTSAWRAGSLIFLYPLSLGIDCTFDGTEISLYHTLDPNQGIIDNFCNSQLGWGTKFEMIKCRTTDIPKFQNFNMKIAKDDLVDYFIYDFFLLLF